MSNRLLIAINIGLSAVICLGLIWLIYLFDLEDVEAGALSWLPHFNAACNATSASFLTLGIILIKKGKKRAHGISMCAATIASGTFLGGYLVHHTVHGDTPTTLEGALRGIYFAILISHILLSVIALPLVLNTLSFAALKRFDAHRAVARWTYPIWLYVSVTGVLVWFFLRILDPGMQSS
jgi:putative membrane protein|tara:strand:- start:2007 stop:2546 length:540 start_codon:yes stop_codon:yes gene_type:complete